MTERDALLRAILQQPEEDTVRLAFADYCDEDGESDYAEFIRGQVAWSKAHNTRTGRAAAKRVREAFRGVVMLRKWAWLNDLMDGPLQLAVGGDGIPGFYTDKNTKGELRLTRGFVSEIRLPCTEFMAHAEAIFRAHPVTKVVLTDVRTIKSEFDGEGDPWTFSLMPDGLYTCLQPPRWWQWWHPTEQAVLDYLSARCVAYGRSLAGLDQLTRTEVPA